MPLDQLSDLKALERKHRILLLTALTSGLVIAISYNAFVGNYLRVTVHSLLTAALWIGVWAAWRSVESFWVDFTGITALAIIALLTMLAGGSFLDPRSVVLFVCSLIWSVAIYGYNRLWLVSTVFLPIILVAVLLDLSGLAHSLRFERQPNKSLQWFVTIVSLLWTVLSLHLLAFRERVRNSLVERAAELAIERAEVISSTNQLLRESQETQRRVFAIVSHELRTPAAAIDLMASQSDLDRSAMSDMRAASRHLLQVIDDIYHAANPDEGFELHETQFSVMGLIKEVTAQTTPLLTRTGLSIRTASTLPDGGDTWLGDAFRARIVLTNLIRNACHHSEGARVQLTVVAEQLTDERYRFVFNVEDDGVGIPVDQRSRLFEAFERGNTRAAGTGVGLYLVRHWSERLGGGLEYFDSELGGAGFRLWLPFTRATENVTNDTDTLLAQARALLADLKVLYVEDVPVLRRLHSAVLTQQLGVEVHLAETGIAAQSQIANAMPDIVLTDYFMPDMDGRELTLWLRQRYQDLPIIALTAATIGKESAELLAAGVDFVLGKPLDVTAFARIVIQLSAERRLKQPRLGDHSQPSVTAPPDGP